MKPVGRARIYKNDAEKMRAYRERQNARKATQKPPHALKLVQSIRRAAERGEHPALLVARDDNQLTIDLLIDWFDDPKNFGKLMLPIFDTKLPKASKS
jgi:hypothetical protein